MSVKINRELLTVADVKINNTSVVSGSSADILTKTAYNAATNKIATVSDIQQAVIAAINANY